MNAMCTGRPNTRSADLPPVPTISSRHALWIEIHWALILKNFGLLVDNGNNKKYRIQKLSRCIIIMIIVFSLLAVWMALHAFLRFWSHCVALEARRCCAVERRGTGCVQYNTIRLGNMLESSSPLENAIVRVIEVWLGWVFPSGLCESA